MPALFLPVCVVIIFQARHTDYDRTKHSAEAHLKLGVFPGVDVYIPPALEEDPLLRVGTIFIDLNAIGSLKKKR